MSGLIERQKAYDFWLESSEYSNDRRNARHMTKINPSNRDIAIVDIQDVNVKAGGRNNSKLKAQKRVYSFTVRDLYKQFKEKNSDVDMSSTLFYRCKPFYVSPATEREMECCLCSKCLNPHALYSALRRAMKDLPSSMSEYLTMSFECSEDVNLNYPKVECIKGSCKNECAFSDDNGAPSKRMCGKRLCRITNFKR